MSGHTPGPWEIDEGWNTISHRNEHGKWRLLTVRGTDPSFDHANAILVAAAPDQNEALHVAVTVWRDAMEDMRHLMGTEAIIYKRMENALGVMCQAIAKAEGRS